MKVFKGKIVVYEACTVFEGKIVTYKTCTVFVDKVVVYAFFVTKIFE